MKQHPIDAILIALGGPLTDATLTEKHMATIRKAAPGTEIMIVKDPEDWGKRSGDISPDIEVIFAKYTWAPHFQEMPNLRWFQQTGAGANWLLQCPEIATGDLIVTNTGTNTVPISEHVMALMLILARGIQRHIRRQIKHKWERSGTVVDLAGSTLGIVGVGRIGEAIAERAKGMDMRILGLRRNPERSVPHIDKMYGPTGLFDLLAWSDWVVLTAALTAETIGMIGEKELMAMKESAHIINVARGPLIQEKALNKALEEGWIAGAGLDVFEHEPLPEDSPLWDMDHVVITPHCSFASPYKMDRLIDLFAENLRRYQNNEPMINVVDKQQGY